MIDYEIEEKPLPFTVTDDSSATWAMRKFRAQVEKMRENERIARAELDRISKWLDEVNKPLAQSAEYFEGLLLEYGRKERDAGRKSVKLIDGTIKSRVTQPKVEVDESVFIEWAQRNHRDDLLIFPEPKPNKTALKAETDIPGVVVIEGSVSYSIEVRDED